MSLVMQTDVTFELNAQFSFHDELQDKVIRERDKSYMSEISNNIFI